MLKYNNENRKLTINWLVKLWVFETNWSGCELDTTNMLFGTTLSYLTATHNELKTERFTNWTN